MLWKTPTRRTERRARHTGRHSSIRLEALETRALMSANIIVLGGGEFSKAISNGSTTPSFDLMTDFGVTDVNHTAQTRVFYIANQNGDAPLTLSGNPTISIAGDTSAFTISAQPDKTTIQPLLANTDGQYDASMYTSFTVQFLPQTAGVFTATITIPSNDPIQPAFTFAIQGTAQAATTVTGGTETITTQAGSGATADSGDILICNYTGYLTDGTVFDSSLNTGRSPFRLKLGAGSVIEGWENGLEGMKVGESRTLIIPPDQGYGSTANGNIPADSTLIFNVTLLDTVGPNFIPTLYRQILGREPDAAGLTYWENQLLGTSNPAQVTSGFVTSTEYRTNRIEALYQQVFGRGSDPTGLNYWLNYLATSGNNVDTMSSLFYGSQEFYNNNGAASEPVVNALYRAMLGRDADPTGLEYWSTQFDSGVPASQLAYQLLKSPETEQRTVTILYNSYLHRGPDEPGLAYWVNQMTAGASETDVMASFLSSVEFYSV